MKTTVTKTECRLYVGTYAKYNNGDLTGAWLDLSDYNDQEDFIEACKELHKDETDPELMFQDSENIPESLYSESSVNENLWEYMELDEDEREALSDWLDNGNEFDIDSFRDDFAGQWGNEEKFADNLAEELGYFAAMKEAGMNEAYFDVSAFARDLFCGDYWISDNGYVFRNS